VWGFLERISYSEFLQTHFMKTMPHLEKEMKGCYQRDSLAGGSWNYLQYLLLTFTLVNRVRIRPQFCYGHDFKSYCLMSWDFDTLLWTANQHKDLLKLVFIHAPVSSNFVLLKYNVLHLLLCCRHTFISKFFHSCVCPFLCGTVDMGYF